MWKIVPKDSEKMKEIDKFFHERYHDIASEFLPSIIKVREKISGHIKKRFQSGQTTVVDSNCVTTKEIIES